MAVCPALPHQNVITIRTLLDRERDAVCGGKNCRKGLRLSHRRPAPDPGSRLHQSRGVWLKTHPSCFEEQLGTPVFFNLSKDLLLFADDNSFLSFLKRSFNTHCVNDFGLSTDLYFQGICGPIYSCHSVTSCNRPYLFDHLEKLILENLCGIPSHEVNASLVIKLTRIWTTRRARMAKRLKGYVSMHDLGLPKVFFSLLGGS
jgi:hypothetical protein